MHRALFIMKRDHRPEPTRMPALTKPQIAQFEKHGLSLTGSKCYKNLFNFFCVYQYRNNWLYINSVACVKQNAAERGRREAQGVPAEMPTRNVLRIADVGKDYNVRIEKMRQSNGRMRKDYPVVHSTVTEQKFSSQRRKSKVSVNRLKKLHKCSINIYHSYISL